MAVGDAPVPVQSPAVESERETIRALAAGVTRVAAVLLALVLVGLILDRFVGLPPIFRPPLTLAGLAPIAFGLLLEGWATVAFWTLGGGTPNPTRPPRRLVTRGPYRVSRNPLYIARFLVLSGTSILLGSLGILALTLALILLVAVKLPHEERRLAARFGDEYESYRARVPRWILWPPPRTKV